MADNLVNTTMVEAEQRARHFWRNLGAVSAWELMWGFGAACVAGPIVMALALQLTPSKAVIGLLGFMQILAVPTLLVSAYLNRRLRRRRVVVMWLHCAQVLNWALVGLACLVPAVPSLWLLVGLIGAHGLIYLVSGLVTAPTYELLGGAFGRRFGAASGVQLLVNRGAGVAGGLVAEALLRDSDFPANFGRVLLLGAVCLTVSNLTVLAMVEVPSRAVQAATPRITAYLTDLGMTVRGHRDYVVFLSVVALLAFMTVVQGFFTTFALEELGLPVAQAGIFAAVVFAATGAGGLSGALGDRWGHRQLLLAALAAHAVATLAVLMSQATGVNNWFFIGLAASGAATAAASIATTNLMVDFAPEGERGAYAAVGRLATLGAGAAFTPLGGWLIDLLGYVPLFGTGVLLVLIGIGITLGFGEPRRLQAV